MHLSPFAPALPGRNSAFREGFKTCAKHVPPGPQTLPGSFSPLPALCPLPLPCQVEILHLEGFKTCAKHVPPGPQNPPCSFIALCQRFARSNIAFRRFPRPCQARFTRTRDPPVHLSPFAPALPGRDSAFKRVSKPARSTFHQGPKPFRATLAHLASALPSPLALALPGRNTAFGGFQNLREARSTRAPKPSVQL